MKTKHNIETVTSKAKKKATKSSSRIEETIGTSQKITIQKFLVIFDSIKEPNQKCIPLITDCLRTLNKKRILNSDEKVISILLDFVNGSIEAEIKILNGIKLFKGKFKHKELIESMKLMREYENVLFTGLPDYRDHFFHQFWVYLIGVLLIEFNYEDVCHRVCNEIYDKKEIRTKKEIYKLYPSVEVIWTLTALLHDHAYVLEKIDTITKNIYEQMMPYAVEFDKLYEKPSTNLLAMIMCSDTGEDYFNRIIDKILLDNGSPTFLKNLRELFKKQLLEEGHAHSHAMLSALSTLTKLHEHVGIQLDDNRSPVTSFVYYIVTSIAMHHIKHEDMKNITDRDRPLENHFFTFLLRICDYVQEWNREDRIDKRKFGIELNDIFISDEGLNISVTWRNEFQESLADKYHKLSKKYFKDYDSDFLSFKLIYEIIHKTKPSPYVFPAE